MGEFGVRFRFDSSSDCKKNYESWTDRIDPTRLICGCIEASFSTFDGGVEFALQECL